MQLDSILYHDTEDDLFTGTLGLMGTWEVARYLGVERSRIARWLTELGEGKTPIAPPVARVKAGPFWTFDAVEQKLADMYEETGSPYGKSKSGRERWAKERRTARQAREAALRDAA